MFNAAGTAVPTGYLRETRLLGEELAQAVTTAVSRHATWSCSATLWSASAPVCIPLNSVLFIAAAAAGVFATRPIHLPGCRAVVPLARTGSGVGHSLLTDVGSYQIDDGGFLQLTGEVFPFTYLRRFPGTTGLAVHLLPSAGLAHAGPTNALPLLRGPRRRHDRLSLSARRWCRRTGGVPDQQPDGQRY